MLIIHSNVAIYYLFAFLCACQGEAQTTGKPAWRAVCYAPFNE